MMQLSGRAASAIDEDRHHEQEEQQLDDDEDESFFSAVDSDGRLSEQESELEDIRPDDVNRSAKDRSRSSNCANEDSDIIAPSINADSFGGGVTTVVVHEAEGSGAIQTAATRASREAPAIPIDLADGSDNMTCCGSLSPSGTVEVDHDDDARRTRRGERQRGGCIGSRSRSRATDGGAYRAGVGGDGRVFIACFAAISVSDLREFEVRTLEFT